MLYHALLFIVTRLKNYPALPQVTLSQFQQ